MDSQWQESVIHMMNADGLVELFKRYTAMYNDLKMEDEPAADPPAWEEARQLMLAVQAAKQRGEQFSSKGPGAKSTTGGGLSETESESSSSGSRPQSMVTNTVRAIDRAERQAARRDRKKNGSKKVKGDIVELHPGSKSSMKAMAVVHRDSLNNDPWSDRDPRNLGGCLIPLKKFDSEEAEEEDHDIITSTSLREMGCVVQLKGATMLKLNSAIFCKGTKMIHTQIDGIKELYRIVAYGSRRTLE